MCAFLTGGNMGYRVDNAIIMAAGYASRFAPLSYEAPKALLKVKGEILIERQIEQLRQAGIEEIIVVVGYKKEQFLYLKEKYGIILIENKEYHTRNNHSTIYAAKEYLKNTYICSADNYFADNPFEAEVEAPYYAAVYSDGETKEWCMAFDENDWITNVIIGGQNAWYMLGHAFWSEDFSRKFRHFLEEAYDFPETKNKFWEEIYMDHIDEMKLKIRRYEEGVIFEFDSLDELRLFDKNYVNHSGSAIMKNIASRLNVEEGQIHNILPVKGKCGEVTGFYFQSNGKTYRYLYHSHFMNEAIKLEDQLYIEELLERVLGITEITNISKMGGLTNRTYLVEAVTSDKYVVRLPGEGTEKIINRKDEKVSTELACQIGIDARLYYFDENTGVKISKYIDNSQTMNSEMLKIENNIIHVANILNKLHSSDIDTEVSFDVIDMAETYEHFIKENNGFFYDDYQEVKGYINTIKLEYMPSVEKKPCHNDPLCENWVLQNDSDMYLIDWEYAGMNDPIWDLADVSIEAEYTEEMDNLLLVSYFGHEPTISEWKAFHINKVLIDYLWSLWGKTRAVYDGQDMEDYALERYIRMKKNMVLLG
ncbi:MAG: hypothetical protein E7253_08835 [Lachnospiraceae bacterium]|nr:hypothetical protein [Lachnospiraceae bacterium]